MARTGIMLAHPYELRRVAHWSDCLYQRKYNGHRCKAYVTEHGVELRSSEGNLINTMPHIASELQYIAKYKGPLCLDGELYNHELSRQQIQSVVNRKSPAENHQLISYHVYDMWIAAPQDSRIYAIESIAHDHPNLQHIEIVPTFQGSVKQALACCQEFVAEGYEGVILRNMKGLYEEKRSKNLIKYKPTETDEYVIDSVFEAVDKFGFFKGMAGGLTVHDAEGNSFRVGAGKLSHSERYKLWQQWQDNPISLIGHIAVVKYPEKSDGGIPVQSILITIK